MAFADIRDQVQYKAIKVGNLLIMRQNLACTVFLNGNPIPAASDALHWEKAGKHSEACMCLHAYDPSGSAQLGRLYNEFSVKDPRGIAPEGWRIPTETDLNYLINHIQKVIPQITNKSTLKYFDFVEYESIPDNKTGLSGALKGIVNFMEMGLEESPEIKNWNSIATVHGDPLNFSALPTGYCDSKGIFSKFGESAYYWIVSGNKEYHHFALFSEIVKQFSLKYVDKINPGFGYSVRCVKDFS